MGLGIGALAALPFGPVGMVCVQRTLSFGARSGVISAGGMALASALWCLAAVQGLGLLSRHLPLSASWFRLALGLVLVGLALKNLVRPPAATARLSGGGELASQFLVTLLLVLANPLTPVTVAALLAAFGLGQASLKPTIACGLAFAVFVGGVALWVFLTCLLTSLRGRMGEGAASRLNRFVCLFALMLGMMYVVSAGWAAR